jgi:hypothetical protein
VGAGDLTPGSERPGRETDHSLPPGAEVNNEWSYTSIPPKRLHGVVLISEMEYHLRRAAKSSDYQFKFLFLILCQIRRAWYPVLFWFYLDTGRINK